MNKQKIKEGDLVLVDNPDSEYDFTLQVIAHLDCCRIGAFVFVETRKRLKRRYFRLKTLTLIEKGFDKS